MGNLTIDGWITIICIVAVFAAMQLRRNVPTDLLFLGALVVVTLAGVITPADALSGFSSNALITIAGLLVCADGLQATGVLDWVGRTLLGSVNSERNALTRLAGTLVVASSFILNTALVAMTMPFVLDWCRKRSIAPSRMLIPVSYLTILGGVCTLVGTSTTLVVNEQLKSEYAVRADEHGLDSDKPFAELTTGDLADKSLNEEEAEKVLGFMNGLQQMRLFEIGFVGLPCALTGTGILLLVAPILLPDRLKVSQQFGEHSREYLVELQVRPECPLIGLTVENAGLRSLPGLFLVEINRRDEVITPVTPTDVIHSGDRLVFTGIVTTIVDLEKIPGLIPAADLSYDPSAEVHRRHLTEVVLSRTCPLIGTTVREGGFRRRYGAAIIAVHRNGARLTNKIGDIILEPGDTLLLQTRGNFVEVYRDHRDFYLVSTLDGAPRRHDRALLAAGFAFLLIVWLCLTNVFRDSTVFPGLGSTALAAITVAGLMTYTRCLSVAAARSAINIPLLVTIAAALGLAKALDKSGAASQIAGGIVNLVGKNPMMLLAVIYLLTVLFTEMISNTAVAAAMCPLAVSVAFQSGYSPRPFIIAITLAASLSFLSPIGYQTNLMVMGPGGYRPSDYFRVGLPVAVTVCITALLLIPQIWNF
ncbi:MAG: SLC13 family permease [Planctomycetota bacterium]